MSQLHVFDDGTDLVVAEDEEDAVAAWVEFFDCSHEDQHDFEQRDDLDRIEIGNRNLLCKNWAKQGRGFLGTRPASDTMAGVSERDAYSPLITLATVEVDE